jgi:hypothetical protein
VIVWEGDRHITALSGRWTAFSVNGGLQSRADIRIGEFEPRVVGHYSHPSRALPMAGMCLRTGIAN